MVECDPLRQCIRLGSSAVTRNACIALPPRSIQGPGPIRYIVIAFALSLDAFHKRMEMDSMARSSSSVLILGCWLAVCECNETALAPRFPEDSCFLAVFIDVVNESGSEVLWHSGSVVAAGNWRRDWPKLKIEGERGRPPMEPDLEGPDRARLLSISTLQL